MSFKQKVEEYQRGGAVSLQRIRGVFQAESGGVSERRSCVLATDTRCLSSRKWRSIRKEELCPSNGYAVSFKQKVEESQGYGDDTAPSTLCALSAIQEMKSAANKQVGAHGTKVLDANIRIRIKQIRKVARKW